MKTGLFNNCTSLVTLTIPNTVSRMEVNIFIGCTNLANIILKRATRAILWFWMKVRQTTSQPAVNLVMM